MSGEQMAKLRAGSWVPIHLLGRLLLERERLLDALKREHESDTGISEESLAAISFAEESAPL